MFDLVLVCLDIYYLLISGNWHSRVEVSALMSHREHPSARLQQIQKKDGWINIKLYLNSSDLLEIPAAFA